MCSVNRVFVTISTSLSVIFHPNLPYVIVGDEAFPLKNHMMRPTVSRKEPTRVTSYIQLSPEQGTQGHRKHLWDTYCYRWRIFQRPIIAEPDNVFLYTKAAIGLHNFLCTTEPSIYFPSGFTDSEDVDGSVGNGSWREEQGSNTCLQPVHRSNHHLLSAANV